MASIRPQRQTKSGPRYDVYYRDPSGRQRVKTFRRKSDAERFLIGVEHSKHAGTYVDERQGRVLLRDYAEEWIAGNLHLRAGSADRARSALNRWILPQLGDRALASVRQDDVQRLVALMAESLAPSTVEVTYSFLASIYKRAVRQRRVAFTPCLDIRLPEVVKPPVTPLKEEEIVALASGIGDRYRAMLLVAAGTGLREGELWGLTTDRVDFMRRTVTVNRQLVTVRDPSKVQRHHEHIHGHLYFGPVKRRASERVVPVEQAVIDVLALHLAKYPAGIKGLIFTTSEGMPIHRNRFHEKPWATAKKHAGLEREVVFHDLRNFTASLWIYQGRNVVQVARWLGHKDATETLNTYAGVFEEAEDDLTREQAQGMLDRIVAAVGRQVSVPPTAVSGE